MRNTCLNMIYELAQKDPSVLFIGSDLSPGLLDDMRRELPNQYFMEGISEANIIGMAAGLAMDGYVPFVVTIASFITRRCYEQIALDLCLQNLPVRLVGIGAGLNYAPLGPTHQAIEDIAIMRALPNMTIVAPSDAEEMKRLMQRTPEIPGPLYLRLAKGFDPIVSREEKGFEIGKAILMREAPASKSDVLFITTGIMTTRALAAAAQLAKEGIESKVLHVHTLKPLDEAAIVSHARNMKLVLTLEEHKLDGGLGSACTDILVDQLQPSEFPKIRRLGIPDSFAEDYGTQDSLLESFSLQPPEIAKTVKSYLICV